MMGRKLDPRVLEELRRQREGGKPEPAPVAYTPAPPPPPPPGPAPQGQAPIIIQQHGTSGLSVFAGVVFAVLFLLALPWLLAGGCLACGTTAVMVGTPPSSPTQ